MLGLFFDHNSQENGQGSRVRNALLRLVLEGGYSSSITSFILSVALIAMVRRVISPLVLQGWLGGMTALFLLRITAIFFYRRKQQGCEPITMGWVRTYVFLLLLTGLMWGLGVIFFFKTNAIMEQMAVIFIIAGLTAGAIPIIAPLRRLYFAYIAGPLLPLVY
ncbi:MAG: hypothetical protein WC001_11315, partial [Desulfurivibrionaceae bacterium]